jgi:hypothetical protein
VTGVASPIIDLSGASSKAPRQLHQSLAIETGDLAAGCSIALHGDGAAGKDEVACELKIEDFRLVRRLIRFSIFNLQSDI